MVNMELCFTPQKKYMRQAIALAEEAAGEGEVPVGAVIERNGRVIAAGRNRREQGKNALLHAEMEAIDMACRALGSWRLADCRLYVTLEPCPMCMGAILNARIPQVVFGAEDFAAGCCGSAVDMHALRAYRHPQVFRGFMEEPCRQLMSKFFAALRDGRKTDF